MFEVSLAMNRAPSPGAETPTNSDLADLLMRVAEVRDKSAFTALFEHFGPRIKGFMMRKGTDAELAEDLAQDTMITVWRKAHMYSRDKGTVSTWIFTIARNRRIDWARRSGNVKFSDIADYDQASDDPQSDETVTTQQEAKYVAQAIEALPDDQKQVISMAFMEDLTQMEISTRLNLPLGTVKSRMRLAYQKLTRSLEGLQ
ncbi:MAG: sigma-70 family RNA polymerase sigma factor [Pseudomonadota bacterium]